MNYTIEDLYFLLQRLQASEKIESFEIQEALEFVKEKLVSWPSHFI